MRTMGRGGSQPGRSIFPVVASVALLAVSFACGRALLGFRRGSLEVDAKIVYTSGAAQDGASRVRVLLLDDDFIRLAMSAGEGTDARREHESHEGAKLVSLAGLMNARRREAYSTGPDIFPLLEGARPVWEAHVVREVETADVGADGEVVIGELEPGVYWLVVSAQAAESGRGGFWNLRLAVERGVNRIKLDSNNALYFR